VRLTTLSTARLAAVLLAWFGVAMVLWGQQSSGSQPPISLATDWSHHHLIYSQPSRIDPSTTFGQDPRYWQQWLRRNGPPAPNHDLAANPFLKDEFLDDTSANSSNSPQRFHRDWSMSLGPGATVGAGQFPAKFSFSVTTANCANAAQPDFVVFNTSAPGSSSQATVVAFDNLYSGCTGIVPQTYWAYNTGGTVVTSVTLSYDGSQIAFVQSSAGRAQLVLLKWQASTTATSTSPGTITVATASQYPNCGAPCMTTLTFSGGANDTNSSTFLDYPDDTLYVGDDNGILHKFTPVFTTGAPAEVTTSGWPVTLAPGLMLSGPVYDQGSGKVFVGSAYSTSGSQLFAVLAATGAVTGTSSGLGKGVGLVSGPIVDSTAGQVYVFIGNDGTTACYPTNPCSAVYQFPTSFTSGTGIKATAGAGGSFPLYLGDFDNAYYSSANATGSLYVCGGGFPPPGPTVFRIPVTSGTMSTSSVAGPAMGLSNTACSPLTEVYNPAAGGTDRIFTGVPNGSDAAACSSGGCINDFIVTAWQPLTNYALGQRVIDSSNDLEIVVTAGESGSSPIWDEICGFESIDSGVTWLNTGFLTPVTPQAWKANSGYSEGARIIDSNGNYECAIVSGGETGTSPPTWKTNIGGTVYDASEEWRNVGPPPNYALPETGGTSGVIMDNVAHSILITGTSQVYFSTLGTGGCGTGNGCAVQASQSALN
jgi:hypothetical protein